MAVAKAMCEAGDMEACKTYEMLDGEIIRQYLGEILNDN